jgi:hypothetical protein
MPTNEDAAEMAQVCREQAALTTSPDVRYCFLKMADYYQAEAEQEERQLHTEENVPGSNRQR